MSTLAIPVLTIDGPSGAGKGTVSRLLAAHLGWHLLDSGALYRAVGYAAGLSGVNLADIEAVTRIATLTHIAFHDAAGGGETQVLVNGNDATDEIRTETCGAAASAIAVMPSVREALLDKQHAFRSPPGLVADGRDMGTVIFPDAVYKVFLTASVKERGRRRYKQLKEKGVMVRLDDLTREIEARDARDASRKVAPLKPARGALQIDTTGSSIENVVEKIVRLICSVRRDGKRFGPVPLVGTE